MTPKEVLEFAKGKKIEMVDLKFMDFVGTWQHFAVPIYELGEDNFEDGFGFDGSSIRGWQPIHASDMLVIPDADTAVVDPFIWCTVTFPLIYNFVPRSGISASAADDAPAGAGHAPQSGFGPLEGLKVPAFYLLFFASFAAAITGVAFSLNLVPILTFTGVTRSHAVWIAGSMGIAAIIGRLVGGVLMDRYDVRKLAMAAAAISLILPVGLLLQPGVAWMATVAVFSWGLTGGMKMNAVVYLTSTYMGARSFGFFYGAISITTTVAMGVSPFLANYIYDVTHSYWPVVWAAIPGFIIAGLLFFALGPQPDFDRHR